MTMLAIGLALWMAAHWFRSVAPRLRDDLIAKIGAGPYRAVVTIDIVIALGLIIWGYRSADWIAVAMVSPTAGHCGSRGRQSGSVSLAKDSVAACT